MGLIQFDCEVIDPHIIPKKENDEIEQIYFIMHKTEISIGFIDSDRNKVIMQFEIEKTDAILLAKSILLNYNN
jgi:hypothetical protein